MSEPRDMFRTTLEGDSDFATPLTGGIYDASELPDQGLTPSQPQEAWDANGVLKPSAVIRWRGWSPYGPYNVSGSERGFVEIYLYEVNGVAVLETAANALKALMHRNRMIADGATYWFRLIHQTGIVPADEVGGAQSLFCRFSCIRVR